jgi:hypothetical protein
MIAKFLIHNINSIQEYVVGMLTVQFWCWDSVLHNSVCHTKNLSTDTEYEIMVQFKSCKTYQHSLTYAIAV